MALLNRFSRLNDRGETGIFTFIVTKSVTRDFHRDATTKDFCFGYHRWAISFQRPSEKVLGVHLLLRNPSPNTACVVDFTLTLLNRQHFSQNESYTKRQAKFTITNPMQGVARWIQMSDLVDRNFSSETGEFLFELALSNMSTIFECDIQLNAAVLNQYKSMLKNGTCPAGQLRPESNTGKQPPSAKFKGARSNSELINLETNYFTFGAFDWSLTIVPLVLAPSGPAQAGERATGSSGSSSSLSTAGCSGPANLASASRQHSGSSASIASGPPARAAAFEPVCRVYLNRLSGFDSLCRVKYRVILGHHQQQQQQEHADSRLLDQISDSGGRIRGYQFRNTNILKLISLRAGQSQQQQQQQQQPQQQTPSAGLSATGANLASRQHQHQPAGSALDLRVHIEMYCANTVSEAQVPLQRVPSEAQVSNCHDRNKQAWCVESDTDTSDTVRLKLFFMDLQSVPRNHIRYISWIAYIVRRLGPNCSSSARESIVVKNAPHSNYYLQDGIDMGTIMDTELSVKELQDSAQLYLENNQLTVHIEWVDSLLLFSHLYNNYDSLATVQRHQIRRELNALQLEYAHLESKYAKARRTLNQLTGAGRSSGNHSKAGSSLQQDYSSTDSSSCFESLPAPVIAEPLVSQESNVLAPGGRSSSTNDHQKVAPAAAEGQLRPAEYGASRPLHHQLGPGLHAAAPPGEPPDRPPAPIRLESGWPAYEAGARPTARRRLPQQPVTSQLMSQPPTSYGRLSQVSLSSEPYLAHHAGPPSSEEPDSVIKLFHPLQEGHPFSPAAIDFNRGPPSLIERTHPPDRYQQAGSIVCGPISRLELGAPELEPAYARLMANDPAGLSDPELDALYRSALVEGRRPEVDQLGHQVGSGLSLRASDAQLEQFKALEQYGSM